MQLRNAKKDKKYAKSPSKKVETILKNFTNPEKNNFLTIENNLLMKEKKFAKSNNIDDFSLKFQKISGKTIKRSYKKRAKAKVIHKVIYKIIKRLEGN